MTNTHRANPRGTGFLATRAKYIDAVGLPPSQLRTVLAVMAFERTHGTHPTTQQVRQFIGTSDLELNALTGGLWLTVEGKLGSRTLSARTRAWQTLGFSREERRSA